MVVVEVFVVVVGAFVATVVVVAVFIPTVIFCIVASLLMANGVAKFVGVVVCVYVFVVVFEMFVESGSVVVCVVVGFSALEDVVFVSGFEVVEFLVKVGEAVSLMVAPEVVAVSLPFVVKPFLFVICLLLLVVVVVVVIVVVVVVVVVACSLSPPLMSIFVIP